jgi:hypothetical protein
LPATQGRVRSYVLFFNLRRILSSCQADYCLLCIPAEADEIEITTKVLPLHETIMGSCSRASANEVGHRHVIPENMQAHAKTTMNIAQTPQQNKTEPVRLVVWR